MSSFSYREGGFMKPTARKKRRYSSIQEWLSKGDLGMRTIFHIAAAIYIAAASCAWAGTFDGLAAAASAKPPTPLFLQPGSIVKTEFKSNPRSDSDMDLEAEFSSVAQAAAKNSNKAQPKPAVAYREGRPGTMAPPPKVRQQDKSTAGRMVAADDDSELEADLEKDLVLTPPPPKTEEKVDRTPQKKPVTDKKAIEKRPAITEKKVEKPKTEPRVRKMAPAEYEQYAVSPKPIQKVRPVTRNFWSFPAGAYDNRPCPVDVGGPACSTNPAYAPPDPRASASRQYRPMSQEYSWPRGTHQAQRGLAAAPTGYPDRVVRDGVTIKLAPAAAPAGYMEYPEESSGSDLLSTAVEIIGLPFAFIGSLF
jgi:hypothetical protein